MKTIILWMRLDFRLADNPALVTALKRGVPVIPLFIWSPEDEGEWSPGGASNWWLHQSLSAFDTSLRELGSRLVVRRGPTIETLRNILKETGASAVFWNRRYEPAVIARDKHIKVSLKADGIIAESFNAALLNEPWEIQNKSGKPFQVFTPFWKHCLTKPDPEGPLPAPTIIPAPAQFPKSLTIDSLGLQPRINWTSGIKAAWQPGEAGARAALIQFLQDAFENYSETRNRPDKIGTSRLSPHLHFGEISPRQIWHGLRIAAEKRGWTLEKWRGSQFLAEIGWREFAHHLLYHFQHTPTEPLRHEGPRFRPSARRPFGYRWYDPDRLVLGKRMEDHLRFAVCWWHSFVWSGSDPFGDDSFLRPWHAAGGEPTGQLEAERPGVAHELLGPSHQFEPAAAELLKDGVRDVE